MYSPGGTIWGNPLLGSYNAHASHVGSGYAVLQQFNGVSSSFNTVTVYGIYTSFPPIDPMEFVVDFYANGSLPGELVSSSTTTANYVKTGEILLGMYPVYSYTLDIRTNVMSDGYVSPVAQLGTDYWY